MNNRYVAMWSFPGCLPEMQPADFDTFEEAREFLVDEITRIADSKASEGDMRPWQRLADLIRSAQGPVSETAPDGYVYTIDCQPMMSEKEAYDAGLL